MAKSGFAQKDGKFSGRATKIRPAAILAACPDFAALSQGLGWPDLHRAATKLFPQMGLSPEGWREVEDALGSDGASLALALTSEKLRRGEINRPAGYLRGIAKKVLRGERVNLTATYFSIAKTSVMSDQAELS